MIMLIAWTFNCLIGGTIGHTRGRGWAGFWLAFFLGPIGWLVVLLLGDPNKEAEQKAQQDRIEELQRANLNELRKIHAAGMVGRAASTPVPVADEFYFLRIGGKEVGPLSMTAVIELYEAGKLPGNSEVALAALGQGLVFSILSEELPLMIARKSGGSTA